jgi:hypothetical protein
MGKSLHDDVLAAVATPPNASLLFANSSGRGLLGGLAHASTRVVPKAVRAAKPVR